MIGDQGRVTDALAKGDAAALQNIVKSVHSTEKGAAGRAAQKNVQVRGVTNK
jgi:hypothetical protein